MLTSKIDQRMTTIGLITRVREFNYK